MNQAHHHICGHKNAGITGVCVHFLMSDLIVFELNLERGYGPFTNDHGVLEHHHPGKQKLKKVNWQEAFPLQTDLKLREKRD
jgi:hypothetical protein